MYIIPLNCTLKNYENATMRHPLVPVRMAIAKKSPNNMLERVWRKRNPLVLLVGM